MARRKHTEEHVNHERWLVSYADFITLLFAFFVVMYSISQINESKYRVLSNTLTDAFNQPELAVHAIEIGETAKSNPINLVQLSAMAIKDKEGKGKDDKEGEMPDQFKEISSKIEEALGELIKQNMVTLRGNEQWLEIEMRSSLLFDSGDATLSNKALELLGQIGGILREQKTPVRVEGFTDNIPIHSSRFPSNWELSSARAAAVVQLFIEEGLDPTQLMATGYGEFQPIADNDTPENRSKNRRVVLMISKTGELRPQLKAVAPAPVDQSQNSAAPTSEPSVAPVNIAPAPIVAAVPAAPVNTAPVATAPATSAPVTSAPATTGAASAKKP
ncbi:MAG TPA: flagellar motor protein MotD [Spongiibacteraceae bacterium]|nr:flagellar motor protein MotD [Spongiibacteraceae bacterium]